MLIEVDDDMSFEEKLDKLFDEIKKQILGPDWQFICDYFGK